MLTVADFLAQLDEHEHHALVNALTAGFAYAGLAADSLKNPTRQAQDVDRLLASLSGAIRQFETAHELVRQRA